MTLTYDPTTAALQNGYVKYWHTKKKCLHYEKCIKLAFHKYFCIFLDFIHHPTVLQQTE